MPTTALRDEVSAALRAFAWDQWAQLGVLASTSRRDVWAADPEALLLFTLEVARDEPRLFDEVLDWLLANERLISVQRLRNLARGDEDRALVEAALGWAARRRPRQRLVAKPASQVPHAQPLFRTSRTAIRTPDEIFLQRGWLKPVTEPSGKSQAPDLATPISFAFRMRHLLGVGTRAEVVRILLTSEAPWSPVQVIAESAGYAKRNVQEALTSLFSAGVVDAIVVANEQRYGLSRERWAELLATPADRLPIHRDWPQLLFALRQIDRWLHDPRQDGLSEYMRASEARVLMDEIGPQLRYAGVRVLDSTAPGAAFWPDFVWNVREAVSALS